MVLGDDSVPIIPVARFLKYLDTVDRARNTLQTYAYHLRLYFEYLSQKQLDYRDVTLDDLGRFVLWLKNPYRSVVLFPRLPSEQARTATNQPDYQRPVRSLRLPVAAQDDLASDLNKKMRTYLPARMRAFKSFLHHISGGRPIQAKRTETKDAQTPADGPAQGADRGPKYGLCQRISSQSWQKTYGTSGNWAADIMPTEAPTCSTSPGLPQYSAHWSSSS